jgi:hypothetical protein
VNVQVVENWVVIEGSIAAITPHPDLAGYAVATIAVDRVSPLDGLANLFQDAAGQTIPVNILSTKADELALRPPMRIRLRIRKATPWSAFADPDSLVLV